MVALRRYDLRYKLNMYCPKCNLLYKKKYGVISKCACGYNFVFGKNDIIKDRFMLMLEKKASKNETRYFTMDILYKVYQKHHTRHSSISRFFFFRKSQILDKDSLAQIHYHWQTQSSLRSHKFIDKPNLQQPKNPIGEEVFHYGVERIIVVDEPLKVDLFVKNNKHVEKKALIISSDGYPAYLKSQLQNILEKQPDISIGFLYKPETTIDEQVMRFEQNYPVKLQDKPLWDISANKKYKSQIISLPTKETRSDNRLSWFSWFIPSSMVGIFAANSISTEKETDQNNSEIDTDNIGVDTNSSGIDDMSDFSDDGGFDGVDDNDDDDGGDDSDDDDGGDNDDGGDDDDDDNDDGE